ncbi:FkbM family methyltransferase [Mycoplana sp. BE70]|uniref:FkbM family methyltransferase n=1 Tax=Mycoplana sp. BE70 TaxID=2817775 RepID=UPI00285B1D65|nr:FkbM family methyltransferase [Mycoplana sp. BE70]MDR6757762.1 FkbM family methyltransferase [Mycoplana sp. BE70]
MSSKLKRVQRQLAEKIPDPIYQVYANTRNKLKGYPHRADINSSSGLMSVSDGDRQIYICRRNRLWLYKRSISDRLRQLERAYLLDKIQVSDGAFIDCGANVGELGSYCKAHGLDYHAFEPEPLEADCCDRNNFRGEPRTNRVALWFEEATLSFYSKPNTADSSVFETEAYSEVRAVPAMPLDHYVKRNGIEHIAVLKIEAEGAEPEILAGAAHSLEIARYLTVDCGFERGKENSSTVVEVLNIATSAGYEVLDWNPTRLVFLFRNKRFCGQ